MHLEETSLQSQAAIRMARSADARLIEAIRRGDAEAGRRFVRHYYLGVYRYLLYLTGRPETAEDLTQETFVQAWRSLDTLDERPLLRSWLHRIAHREFLQALRSQRRGVPTAGGSTSERGTVSLEDATELPEPRTAGLAEAVELRAIIGRLPIAEREMVVLHYLEGYTCEEIAEIVGVPAGTVKYRLSEARARLRREFSDEEPDRGRER